MQTIDKESLSNVIGGGKAEHSENVKRLIGCVKFARRQMKDDEIKTVTVPECVKMFVSTNWPNFSDPALEQPELPKEK